MKIRVQANKLGNADVTYLSLVERGANRAPFKITKQETPMINLDLSRVSKAVKKAAPSVVGFLIAKADRTPELDLALKEAGVKIDAASEEGTTVLYKQDDTVLKDAKGEPSKDLVVIKLDADFALVCKGFDPYSLCEDTTFGEILKSQGFMPGFSMATEALYTSMRNSLVTATDQKDAVSKIEAAMGEFHDYVVGLAGSIPQSAFKALESFRKAKAVTDPEDMKDGGKDESSEQPNPENGADRSGNGKNDKKVKGKDPVSGVAKASEQGGGSAANNGNPNPPADDPQEITEDERQRQQRADKQKEMDDAKAAVSKDDITKIVGEAISKAGESFAGSLAKALEPVNAAVATLKASVDTLQASVTEAKKDAKDAKDLAQKTDNAVRGRVVTGANNDTPASEPRQKSDNELGPIDTAFNRNVRKADKARVGLRQRPYPQM